MDEGTLNWLKHFAAYPLNADQRTALLFLREVGAVDALSYRQLTGCPAKRVTRDLSGLKEAGLTIRKGRTSGTYYVPSEVLISAPQTTTPRAQTTTPRVQTTTPPSVITTPPGVITTPQGVITTPQGVITTPLPSSLQTKIVKLKQREPPNVIRDLIVEVCAVRPFSKEELAKLLRRSEESIIKYVTPMLKKRLDYLYPMMVHHPAQAYVAKREESANG